MAVYEASSQDEELLLQMLAAKFPADYVDQTGETPLHRAVKAEKFFAVEALLQVQNCSPNAVDGHQQTALHRAGELRSIKCLAALLKSDRVNIDAEDAWSRTILHWTCQQYVPWFIDDLLLPMLPS